MSSVRMLGLLRTDPEFLDRIAKNIYGAAKATLPVALRMKWPQWSDMDQEQRKLWEMRAIRDVLEDAQRGL